MASGRHEATKTLKLLPLGPPGGAVIASLRRAIVVNLAGMPDAVALLHVPALSNVAEYAYAATVEPPARLVFTAGACPLNAEGRTVAPGDHAAQARQVMTNLKTALAAAGATPPTWSRPPSTWRRPGRPSW